MVMRSLALLALLVLAGCRPDGTFVVVRLDRGATTPSGIVEVDLQLALGAMNATVALADSGHAPIAFPTEKALSIGKAAGPLTVVAVAHDTGGAEVARAQGNVEVVRGQTATLALTFGVVSGDGGTGSDGGSADMPPVKTPALSLDKASFDFGTAVSGTTGNSATFTVTNSGSASTGALTTLLGGSDAGSFTLTADQCHGQSLVAGATCTVAVVFSPAGAGSKMAALTVTGASGGSASATLTGLAVAPGALAALPQSNNYQTVTIGSQSAAATFTITNSGGVASGTMTTVISGSDQSQFLVTADTCNNNTVMPSATCTVAVAFKPTTAGNKSASLTVTASPGGTASATLSGVGQTGASLSFTQNAGHSFSTVDVGTSSQVILQLTNGGQADSGSITTTVSGSSSDFVVDDACNATKLTGGSSCNITVTFQPGTYGSKSLTVAVAASPGGTPATTLTGVGRDQLTLSVSKNGSGSGTVTAPGGSGVSVGSGISCGSACSDAYYRTTTSPLSVTLTAAPTAPATISAWSVAGCGTNTTCQVALSSTPTNVSVTFTLPTYNVTATLKGVGGATGTITSSSTPTPAQELNCASASSPCVVAMNAGTFVTLTATPDPGYYFAGWTAGNCSGLTNTCSFTVSGARSATASFSPANVVFVTSTQYTMATITSKATAGVSGTGNQMISGGDNLCKSVAASAGLRGTNYVSWLATTTSNPLTRIGSTARGWVRSDGKPFADEASGGFAAYTRVLFYVPSVDEKQNPITIGDHIWTGVTDSGTPTASDNCSDWTDTTSTGGFRVGNPYGGPYTWSNDSTYPCNSLAGSFPDTFHLICFGSDYSAVVTVDPPPPTGRRFFLDATGYAPSAGLAGADAACNSEAANRGWSGTYTALLATWTGSVGKSAASRITTRGVPVYRPDGALIANSDTTLLASGSVLLTLPLPDSSGNYDPIAPYPWTGAGDVTALGTAASTCYSAATGGAWTVNSNAVNGNTSHLEYANGWFNAAYPTNCASASPIYCMEN